MPVVPKPAATVILVRDAPHLEVFLQRRVAGMAFAGGMTVFPGGGVAPEDRAPADWVGRPASWYAERLCCDEALATAFVRAAVRETFEECGVLLGGTAPVPAHEREALVTRRRTLDEVLAAAGHVLNVELLHPWARWITPEVSPKRYDTAFFVTAVPPGQEADARTTEAVEASWWSPAEALAAADRGELALMPPTERTLLDLAELPDTAAVLATADERDIVPITPTEMRVRGKAG
ncbi:NUDIX hydrolase [Pseudonocardia thermophila]|uniref:NUDIX hydrolase n=1 Tax=Pseudonocardia thermophila TaxID=1848 RepID=UPI000AA922FD|nr:NUDIX domain-containing protein [Pseudonocardia thermophila]